MTFKATDTQDREPATTQPPAVIVGGGRGATLLSEDAPLVIVGGSYADDLFGGNGDDKIYGGGAGDWLVGKGGDDVIYGGAGNDVIFGGADNDELHGGSGNDSIYGGEGADRIYGGSGEDSLIGGGGNDTFYLGDGSIQYVYGGDGYDMALLDGLGGAPGVIANLATGIAIVPGTGYFGLEGARIVFLDGVEGLVGTDRDDVLTGDDQGNILSSGKGNDTIYGGGGDDSINAYYDGVGALYGGDGNDSFFVSTDGFNTMTGGEGNDIFKFTLGSAPANSGLVIAHITDFDDDGDKIDISWLGMGGGAPMNVIYGQDFSGNGIIGEVQILNNGSSSTVNIDADGNGDIDYVIEVDHPGVQFLAAEDFIL